ncbi:MAG TPA: hypothetical protein VFF11_13655, partial [Candidatus Binatia bacterium]|nr:hypothetical protein [Candidatus Binatia bacterium]
MPDFLAGAWHKRSGFAAVGINDDGKPEAVDSKRVQECRAFANAAPDGNALMPEVQPLKVFGNINRSFLRVFEKAQGRIKPQKLIGMRQRMQKGVDHLSVITVSQFLQFQLRTAQHALKRLSSEMRIMFVVKISEPLERNRAIDTGHLKEQVHLLIDDIRGE